MLLGPRLDPSPVRTNIPSPAGTQRISGTATKTPDLLFQEAQVPTLHTEQESDIPAGPASQYAWIAESSRGSTEIAGIQPGGPRNLVPDSM
jgi:hypothetical protein